MDEREHLPLLHHMEHSGEVGEDHPALHGPPQQEQGEENGRECADEAVEVESDALEVGELVRPRELEEPGVQGDEGGVGEAGEVPHQGEQAGTKHVDHCPLGAEGNTLHVFTLCLSPPKGEESKDGQDQQRWTGQDHSAD